MSNNSYFLNQLVKTPVRRAWERSLTSYCCRSRYLANSAVRSLVIRSRHSRLETSITCTTPRTVDFKRAVPISKLNPPQLCVSKFLALCTLQHWTELLVNLIQASICLFIRSSSALFVLHITPRTVAIELLSNYVAWCGYASTWQN
jgi:hypothetical protein